MTGDARILFFVKNPAPGQVKTRLAAHLGDQNAATLYKLMAEDALAALDASGFPVEIFYAPDEAGRAVARWLGAGRPYASQQGADLGERMENAFRSAFTQGIRCAVLVGSDIPELMPHHLEEALARLKDNGAVLAPAGDGGYTMIGFRADSFEPDAFDNILWGGAEVLETTIANLRRTGIEPFLLTELPDLDEMDDLKRLYQNGARRPGKTYLWLKNHAESLFPGSNESGPRCKNTKN